MLFLCLHVLPLAARVYNHIDIHISYKDTPFAFAADQDRGFRAAVGPEVLPCSCTAFLC